MPSIQSDPILRPLHFQTCCWCKGLNAEILTGPDVRTFLLFRIVFCSVLRGRGRGRGRKEGKREEKRKEKKRKEKKRKEKRREEERREEGRREKRRKKRKGQSGRESRIDRTSRGVTLTVGTVTTIGAEGGD